MISETSITTARGAVYHLDTLTKGWKSVDGGLSRIDIYHDSARKTYRVVAMGKTQAVCTSPLEGHEGSGCGDEKKIMAEMMAPIQTKERKEKRSRSRNYLKKEKKMQIHIRKISN